MDLLQYLAGEGRDGQTHNFPVLSLLSGYMWWRRRLNEEFAKDSRFRKRKSRNVNVVSNIKMLFYFLKSENLWDSTIAVCAKMRRETKEKDWGGKLDWLLTFVSNKRGNSKKKKSFFVASFKRTIFESQTDDGHQNRTDQVKKGEGGKGSHTMQWGGIEEEGERKRHENRNVGRILTFPSFF